jgi:hypothetical protein
MKRILLLSCFFLFACNKDDDNAPLPAATQTGRGIFACHVNGENFIGEDTSNSYYQYVEGEYHLGLGANSSGEGNPSSLGIYTHGIELEQNHTYPLNVYSNNTSYGEGSFVYSSTEGYAVYTDIIYSGELHITRFDTSQHIISGTFWYDLKHPVTGDTVKIRDGRFDVHFGM